MLKWRPFRSTLTFARKLVLALASVPIWECIFTAAPASHLVLSPTSCFFHLHQ